ncbi:hypothetical protein PC121_g18487 [Phytophthora cactorum]|nr:hypothetical protein PC120_g20119 [Phytophthora cactorum]KAG3050250.1 hypothetical protein PC121_g18487 [Phytophthora cactorum]KAG4044770.1 hypothetical protein PC123_g19801 [Phytophthora cactorum]
MPKRVRGEATEGPERRRQRRVPRTDSEASNLGGVVAFNDAWAWLRSAGWYSKPPARRSLDPRFRYIRPGCDLDGQDGVDFLLGEASVLQYTAAITVDAGPQRESGGGRRTGCLGHTGGHTSAATPAAATSTTGDGSDAGQIHSALRSPATPRIGAGASRGRGRGRGRGLGVDAGRGDASTAVPAVLASPSVFNRPQESDVGTPQTGLTPN